MTTIDNYYAKQVEEKLKGRGMKYPSQELVMGLAKAWLGRRPEGDMRTAVFNYQDSKQVLEELLDLRPGLGNMATADLKGMINYQYRLAEDTTLSPEERAIALNRMGIYEKEALYGRGMTEEEVGAIKAGKGKDDAEPLEETIDTDPEADLSKQLSGQTGEGQDEEKSIEELISEKEDALTDYDREQGIRVIEVDGNVYYDYTEPINRLLEQSLKAFESNNVKGIPPKDFMVVLDKLLWFKDQVDNGKPWDLKVDEPWKQQFGELRMPSYGGDDSETFYFRGQPVTRGNLGNLTYGYLGSAMGVPPEILYGMGGAVNMKASDSEGKGLVYWLNEALKAGEDKEYLDGKNDYPFIRMGVSMYQEEFK